MYEHADKDHLASLRAIDHSLGRLKAKLDQKEHELRNATSPREIDLLDMELEIIASEARDLAASKRILSRKEIHA